MNITFSFKNFDPSDHLKKYARRRFEKMGRFFGKAAALEINVVMTVDKIRQRCEVNVNGEGLQLNAMEQTNDMYAAIDLVRDKLESRIKRQISRVREQRRNARDMDVDVFTYTLEGVDEDAAGEPSVAGSRRFFPKPLHLDEAVMQLDQIGGDFLVFINAETTRVNVIYRRNAGGLALIDPVL